MPVLFKAKEFLKSELRRLKNPVLTRDGIMRKKDFFDLIVLIQLRSKMKLYKTVLPNQRARVLKLQNLNDPRSLQEYYTTASEFMEREIDQYERYFQEIIDTIGISREVWEGSNEAYLQGPNTSGGTMNENYELQQVERKLYEYLPQPILPRYLNKERAKEILIDVNLRAKNLFKSKLQALVSSPEMEPLLVETLAYDLGYLDYGIQENIFRFAVHNFELQKDADIKEHFEDFYSR